MVVREGQREVLTEMNKILPFALHLSTISSLKMKKGKGQTVVEIIIDQQVKTS